MVLDVKKPSGEGGNNDEEAKQPHDADPTVADLVSKGDKEEGVLDVTKPALLLFCHPY